MEKSIKRKSKKKAAKRGPKPDVLKLDGNWRDAMKKSLAKKKPPEGWPKLTVQEREKI